MSEKWRSGLVREFCRRARYSDPISAVKAIVQSSLVEANISAPPVRPERIAPLHQVKEIRRVCMIPEGRLTRINDGFVIELRQDREACRQNFTFFHEVAHTFFYHGLADLVTTRFRPNSGSSKDNEAVDPEEERLCNVAAAEFLMPEGLTSRAIENLGPSLSTVRTIAEEFGASYQAAALRFAGLSPWKCIVVKWNLNPVKGQAEPNPRLDWVIRSRGVESRAVTPPLGQLRRVAEGKQWSQGREFMSLGGPKGWYYVESMPCSGRPNAGAISFILLRKDAEELAAGSHLRNTRRKSQSVGGELPI